MLGDLLIILGIFGFATGLLEIILSDKQKAALATGLTKVWYWLDEIRKPSFARWVQRRWPQRIIIGLCILFGLYLSVGMFSISVRLSVPIVVAEPEVKPQRPSEVTPKDNKTSETAIEATGPKPPAPTPFDVISPDEPLPDFTVRDWLRMLLVPPLSTPWTFDRIIMTSIPMLGTLVGIGLASGWCGKLQGPRPTFTPSSYLP
jgi:hypothetical protein